MMGPGAIATSAFFSVRQCLIVAGTFGGVCERNNPPPAPKKDRPRAS
jgi:hypothetical protein